METMAASESLVSDLREIFGARLHSVVAYGAAADGAAGTPVHTLALVEALNIEDLDACARRVHAWRGGGYAIPLLLGTREFARSLDAFPLEFGAIIAHHRVLYGHDPFDGLEVARDDLRRACEIEAKGHLLHLRESYMEAGGAPARVAELVEASAPALRALLENVSRLEGQPRTDPAALTAHIGTHLGADHERALAGVLASLESPLARGDAARLFPAYLAAMEALADYVDGWTARR